jgi:hypothetical protein
MSTVRVVCFTSDNTNWALRPFARLFNQFWSELQPVDIAGYTRPQFELPPNFTFRQIAETPYPAEKFTNGLIEYLQRISDEVFCLFFSDYWLTRGVDHEAIGCLASYLTMHPEAIRLDLTADRLYAGGMHDVEAWGRFDIIETPFDSPYQMSTQACIVNRKNLLSILKPNLSPWEMEIGGNELLGKKYRVFGTRQWPVKYCNGIGTGHGPDGWVEGIPAHLVAEMKEAGWFPDASKVKP